MDAEDINRLKAILEKELSLLINEARRVEGIQKEQLLKECVEISTMIAALTAGRFS